MDKKTWLIPLIISLFILCLSIIILIIIGKKMNWKDKIANFISQCIKGKKDVDNKRSVCDNTEEQNKLRRIMHERKHSHEAIQNLKKITAEMGENARIAREKFVAEHPEYQVDQNNRIVRIPVPVVVEVENDDGYVDDNLELDSTNKESELSNEKN